MGLKDTINFWIFMKNHLLIKSDQNGIESKILKDLERLVGLIKSDQNGIERRIPEENDGRSA